MPRFKIHFQIEKDGESFEDSIIIEAETMAKLQKIAQEEVRKRGADPDTAWSEQV